MPVALVLVVASAPFLAGCLGLRPRAAPWALYLQHPKPRPREAFARPSEVERIPDDVQKMFLEVREDARKTMFEPVEGAPEAMKHLSVELVRCDRASELDTLWVGKGRRRIAWHPPYPMGPIGSRFWVGAHERDGAIRVDVVVTWRETFFHFASAYHWCVVFGSSTVESYYPGLLGHPRFLRDGGGRIAGRYTDDGRLQFFIEQEAYWGVPLLLPIPLVPVPLWTIKKRSVLTEKQSVLDARARQ